MRSILLTLVAVAGCAGAAAPSRVQRIHVHPPMRVQLPPSLSTPASETARKQFPELRNELRGVHPKVLGLVGDPAARKDQLDTVRELYDHASHAIARCEESKDYEGVVCSRAQDALRVLQNYVSRNLK